MANRRYTVFMTVMALWCGGPTTSSAAAQDARITLRVRNDAYVPGDLLAEAKAAVAAIYVKAGIDATFVDAHTDLTIVLLSHHTTEHMRQISQIPNALGIAPGSETALVRLAYVFQPRVDKIAESFRTPRAIVLAVGIAHEVGHLLMFNAHSSTGIMRPTLNRGDFRQAVDGNLLFTQAQASEMRARLARVD